MEELAIARKNLEHHLGKEATDSLLGPSLANKAEDIEDSSVRDMVNQLIPMSFELTQDETREMYQFFMNIGFVDHIRYEHLHEAFRRMSDHVRNLQ